MMTGAVFLSILAALVGLVLLTMFTNFRWLLGNFWVYLGGLAVLVTFSTLSLKFAEFAAVCIFGFAVALRRSLRQGRTQPFL